MALTHFANDHFFDVAYRAALEETEPTGYRKGLVVIRPSAFQILDAGTRIYRFYDAKRAQERSGNNDSRATWFAACAPWWWEYEYYQKIKHFALRNGYTVSYSARLHGAILYQYGEVDRVIRCRVKIPLKVWKGRGKQVEKDGDDPRDQPTMTPLQGVLEAYQLYVPGLGSEASSMALRNAQAWFSEPECWPVEL